MNDICCKEVIISSLTLRGKGTETSPCRRIIQVFEKDGRLIAEHDPIPETYALFDMIHFAKWCIDNKVFSDKIDPNDVIKWLETVKQK